MLLYEPFTILLLCPCIDFHGPTQVWRPFILHNLAILPAMCVNSQTTSRSFLFIFYYYLLLWFKLSHNFLNGKLGDSLPCEMTEWKIIYTTFNLHNHGSVTPPLTGLHWTPDVRRPGASQRCTATLDACRYLPNYSPCFSTSAKQSSRGLGVSYFSLSVCLPLLFRAATTQATPWWSTLWSTTSTSSPAASSTPRSPPS